MSRYYECENILNHCCDKYKKKCHSKKHKKHKRKKDIYQSIDPCTYPTSGSLAPPPSYNPSTCQTMYPGAYSQGSYDNILVLLIIILFLCGNNCNTCCDE